MILLLYILVLIATYRLGHLSGAEQQRHDWKMIDEELKNKFIEEDKRAWASRGQGSS